MNGATGASNHPTMDREESWRVIGEHRRAVADLLDTLTDEEWQAPSLCSGWRVRDVAAHIALAPHPPSAAGMLGATIRARGNFHRLNHDLAVRYAQRPTAELTGGLRRDADSQRLPVLTNYRNILFDVLVHAQDIAIPVGRRLPTPVDGAAAGATHVWRLGWPFHARRRLRGLRLTATDTHWAVGAGDEVSGPIEALLLLLTGRTDAALPRLAGPGAHRLVRAGHS
jgi:uncharacterized protein (TIGR03083 family)